MPIRGLSDRRRLPRLGKIRLGIMVQEPGKKAYPRSTEYLVVPEEVEAIVGQKPKALPIMLPSDDPAFIFPQTYKMYKSAGLWCAGDGSQARRWDEQGNLKEIACPCPFLESGECGPVATLNFLLPDVPGVGIWQITTGNTRSIISLNTSLEMFGRMFGGLTGIPFTLRLDPEPLQRFDERQHKMVKQTLYVLRLDSPRTLREIMEWRAKAGAAVAALMPATEEDEADLVQELKTPPESNGEAGQSATVSAPERPAPAGVAAPTGGTPAEIPPEEWDISLCYAAAKKAGVPPPIYEAFLKHTYHTDVDNLPVAALAVEARAWQAVEAAPAEGPKRRDKILALVNLAMKGRTVR